MKHKNQILAFSALAATAVTLMASGAMEAVNDTIVEKSISRHQTDRAALQRPVRLTPILTGTGSAVNPELRLPAKSSAAPEGYALRENFESWDGSDDAWLPEGWSVEHKKSPSGNHGWKMTQPQSPYDLIHSKCLTYEVFDDEVDEWVLTPEITITAGMELRWSTMTSPYFYDINFSDAMVSKPETYPILNDICVKISTDGGETWELLYSHAEKLVEETNGEFYPMFNYNVRPFLVSLSGYAGKKALIGFQISGKEGNTTFLDDVSVGLPPTRTSYRPPLSNLYFGFSEYGRNVPASIMAGPVFSPVTYANTTPSAASKSFTWTYDNTSGEGFTSNDRHLSVTYGTDYTDEATTRNNWYPFPVLRGQSASTAPDEFVYPGFYQAGGRAEMQIHYTDTDEYEVLDLGMTVADPYKEGSATYADIALPYFGYNQESDRYWSEYTFGMNGMTDKNWAHLEKYGDFFYSPDVPLVIDGIRATGFGKVDREAVFTAEIYLLNAGYVPAEQPYAKAICTGDDITIVDRSSANDYLSLNFRFDEPLVMYNKVAPYFMVAIGGFRDPDHVEYFSPLMSAESNPNQLGLGWIGKWICWDGQMMPFSWTPVANYTDDELVSFYIMLDAQFPWMTGEEDTVDISAGESASITLNSYYGANDITFEGLPEGVEAKAEGRYGETKVTFTALDSVATGECEVKVCAPGVSKVVTLKTTGSESSGISGIEAEGAAVRYYNLQGVEVDRPENGVFIRVEGNKAVKIIKK